MLFYGAGQTFVEHSTFEEALNGAYHQCTPEYYCVQWTKSMDNDDDTIYKTRFTF